MDALDEYMYVGLTGKARERIIKSYPDLIREPLRFEGLLKDIYGSENSKEIFLITTALKARIIDHFQSVKNEDSIHRSIYSMISKLTLEFGLDANLALW